MLLGTPVISSRTASIPEVAGDAAILVNPYDTRELAEAIRTVDADAGLRASLVERGLLQAALFSAESYQKRLDTVYRKFLGAAQPRLSCKGCVARMAPTASDSIERDVIG